VQVTHRDLTGEAARAQSGHNHPRSPGVAAAKYACTRQPYAWLIPLLNCEFRFNQWNCHKECGWLPVMWFNFGCDFTHTMLVLHAMFGI